MKIRYPGPSVPPERREQDEYIPAFLLPLPVGKVIEVPDAHGTALVAMGTVEEVAEPVPADGAVEPPSFVMTDTATGAVVAEGLAADSEPTARRKR